MRLTRIFIHEPLAANAVVKLGAAAAGHVSRVLRMQPGDELILFDGRGGQYTGTLLEVRGAAVTARTGERQAAERESPLQVTLAQGVSRGERMDWVVQKATELGVARIVPVLTERSVVRLDANQAEKKQAHWRGIAIAACEQSGRNRIPEITLPVTLEKLLQEPLAREGSGENEQRLLLDPTAARTASELPAVSTVCLLIGPEGGLSDRERDRAQQTGFQGLRLGPRILRTETAGLAAITLLQGKFGDLR